MKMYSFVQSTGLFLLVFLMLFATSASAQRSDIAVAERVITPALLQEYINFLASDSLKGRNTPSPGLDSAAAYIARQFVSFGLKPLNGSFYQDLDFCYINLGEQHSLKITGAGETRSFSLKNDFVPYDMTGSKSVEADVVFAGYGITAPEFGYDDYKDVDVKGKIVLILRQEPGQTDSAGKSFNGRELSDYAGLNVKLERAIELGAAGILVVSGPLNYNSMRPRGYPWPTLSKTLPRDVLPMRRCDQNPDKIPMVQVGETFITGLFGSTDSLRRIQDRIERSMQPASFQFKEYKVQLEVTLTYSPLGGRNVIGYLQGADPKLNQEAIVIGAHYDHVGFIEKAKTDTDFIFNGADDNASGTSGVIAVAKAFTSMTEKPRRSVIFIAFAGEEKGLLGSATFVRKPLWPLDHTVAMLNLDMISRNDPDTLLIIGAKQNPDLVRIIRKKNRSIGFRLVESKGKRMGGGSDHYNFYRKGIPALFFFTGLHPDYHHVGDNPDRIDPLKAARVSRLVFLTAWEIAGEKRHYKLIRNKTEEEE